MSDNVEQMVNLACTCQTPGALIRVFFMTHSGSIWGPYWMYLDKNQNTDKNQYSDKKEHSLSVLKNVRAKVNEETNSVADSVNAFERGPWE